MDYGVHPEASSSHREMLAALHRFEIDTHHHLHKEHYLLFPRAIALEAELMTSPLTSQPAH
ncbi:hypothetical protein Poly21_50120 [Allorhodopirellula heiligendammensis]|uniref:Iron-sulfur cluster repair di-iron protein n=1 Tax=Allorhodopirellula heiligendammensis TaxID=2714739 RepID=A0A5C6BFZ5_9BACT|nr:hypothetical protein Poly21_50120 [Allorhodopirellula heiligendammensis]